VIIKNKKFLKVNILVTNNEKFTLDCNIFRKKVVSLIDIITRKENQVIKNINFMLCNDEEILSYNMKYLSHKYYTDIITFYYPEKGYIDADVIISLDSVKTNSVKFKTRFESELYRVVIHGILHLCGYKDKSDKQKKLMRKKENEYMKSVIGKQINSVIKRTRLNSLEKKII
jgi:probable rRNA maturation factor